MFTSIPSRPPRWLRSWEYLESQKGTCPGGHRRLRFGWFCRADLVRSAPEMHQQAWEKEDVWRFAVPAPVAYRTSDHPCAATIRKYTCQFSSWRGLFSI